MALRNFASRRGISFKIFLWKNILGKVFIFYLVIDDSVFNDGSEQDAFSFYLALYENWPDSIKNLFRFNVNNNN